MTGQIRMEPVRRSDLPHLGDPDFAAFTRYQDVLRRRATERGPEGKPGFLPNPVPERLLFLMAEMANRAPRAQGGHPITDEYRAAEGRRSEVPWKIHIVTEERNPGLIREIADDVRSAEQDLRRDGGTMVPTDSHRGVPRSRENALTTPRYDELDVPQNRRTYFDTSALVTADVLETAPAALFFELTGLFNTRAEVAARISAPFAGNLLFSNQLDNVGVGGAVLAALGTVLMASSYEGDGGPWLRSAFFADPGVAENQIKSKLGFGLWSDFVGVMVVGFVDDPTPPKRDRLDNILFHTEKEGVLTVEYPSDA